MKKRRRGQRFTPIPLFVCRRISEREQRRVDASFRHEYHDLRLKYLRDASLERAYVETCRLKCLDLSLCHVIV